MPCCVCCVCFMCVLVVLWDGPHSRSPAEMTEIDVDKKLMAIDYFAPVALTKSVLPSMLERRKGHLVVTSSVQGRLAIPFRTSYAAAKHALHGYFESLRAEIADRDIGVTIVCPGYVRTELSKNAMTGDGSAHSKMDATTAKVRTYPPRAPEACLQTRDRASCCGYADAFSSTTTLFHLPLYQRKQGMDPKVLAEKVLVSVAMKENELVVADFTARMAILARALLPDFIATYMVSRARKHWPEYRS